MNLPVRDLETRFLALLEQLKPKPEYLELFRAIVLDTWTTRRMDVESLKAGLERKVVETKKRKERLNDVFIFERAISRETYEEQLDRLNESLAVTALELHDLKVEELDIEAVLDFAQYIALNAPRMWSEASLDQKQRLQVLLFPQGLTFKKGTVRTRSTCLLFRDLREDSAVQDQMVSPMGASSNSLFALLTELNQIRSMGWRL